MPYTHFALDNPRDFDLLTSASVRALPRRFMHFISVVNLVSIARNSNRFPLRAHRYTQRDMQSHGHTHAIDQCIDRVTYVAGVNITTRMRLITSRVERTHARSSTHRFTNKIY